MIFSSKKRAPETAHADIFRSLMKEIFTAEEINLMCIYDTSNKTALLSDLKQSLPDVYDPDMREIFSTATAKLEKLTDTEFLDIGFYIADEYTDEGDFAIAD